MPAFIEVAQNMLREQWCGGGGAWCVWEWGVCVCVWLGEWRGVVHGFCNKSQFFKVQQCNNSGGEVTPNATSTLLLFIFLQFLLFFGCIFGVPERENHNFFGSSPSGARSCFE